MFAFPKIFWWFVEPSNLFLALLALATALLWTRWYRVARGTLVVLAAFGGFVALFPAAFWLIDPLEARFPQVGEIPPDVAGVITLGGAVRPYRTVARNQTTLTGRVERLTEFVAIGRRRPELRLIYTGGSGSIRRQDIKETLVVRRLFTEIGFDPARVTYEDQSRNTYENATMTHALIHPRPDETWVLITSAMHMPRSVGAFRKAGWKVLPYPVDYVTDGRSGGRYLIGFSAGFRGVVVALKEWAGLIAYRVLGRTDSLFPAPDPS